MVNVLFFPKQIETQIEEGHGDPGHNQAKTRDEYTHGTGMDQSLAVKSIEKP